MTGARLRLSVRSAWGEGAVHPVMVEGPLARLGSGPECEVRLPHPAVAAMQARLVRGTDHRWRVEASRRGLRLGGRPLRGSATLADGDVIEAGPFVVVARLLDEQTRDGSVAGAPPEVTARRLANEVAAAGGAGPERLVLVAGPHAGEAGPALRLGEALRIGRSRACEWRFADPLLSRVHARLGRDGCGLWIEDRRSKNGVLVGGERIRRRRRLSAGDVVELGAQRLEVRVAGELLLAGVRLPGGGNGGLDVVVGLAGVAASGAVLGWLLLG